MSPVLGAFGGVIEKIYQCANCNKQKTLVENFVSLTFKRLTIEEIQSIRAHFEDRGYSDGLVYKVIPTPKKSLMNIIMLRKSMKIPLLTLRDYFCHLNFTRSENL